MPGGHQGGLRRRVALGTLQGRLGRDMILVLILLTGTARAFEAPTLHSIVPGIVPRELLPRAIAASATAQQTAIICGPALGGFLYVFGPATVYLLCTVTFVMASILISFVEGKHRAEQGKKITLESLFAGFGSIRKNQILLGAVLAQSICRTARRRDRAVADLRARHSRCRTLGSGPAALGACGWCAEHVGPTRPSRD